jgi:NAD(P)-dependent dehydrogenase (short-subunit alcohol dehydrogenase family)
MNPQPTAIVTGAGSGVGQAAAFLFAQSGFRVALVGRTGGKLAQTQKLIELSMPEAKTTVIAADLGEPDSAKLIVDQTLAVFDRIDVLANIAGQAQLTSVDKITPEAWRQCIDANVSYVAYLTAAAWPTMAAQRSGFIVNVSSLAAFDPFPGFSMYAPAKAALNMFTYCTAMEGREHNIQAVTVAPGAIETPMLRSLFGTELLPKDKTLTPGQVARFIVDLALGKHPFTPGQTFQFPGPGAWPAGPGLVSSLAPVAK